MIRIRSVWVLTGHRLGDEYPFSRYLWDKDEALEDLDRHRESQTVFVRLELIEKHRDDTETVVWRQQ